MEGKERQAVIAEIQRFCIHDGPGIRTTVFFKGCPLSCGWCHNPETQKREPEMLFFSDSCIGCKSCQAVCERGAHRWTKEGHTLDLSRCAFCGKKEECVRACPTGAMKVCGRKFSADKLLEEVLADRPFYGKTGGVTCSGGEPLAQASFLARFLPLCKEKGLHVCLDTSLNAEWETIEPLLPYIDLFLADVKCLDPKKARRYTKADARLSRENLLRLSEKKKPVILRMPLAAGVNDTLEEARARRRLMEKLDNVVRVDCFPVTGHAASKYRALGRKMTVWNQGTDGEEMVKRMEQWMGLEDFGKEIP